MYFEGLERLTSECFGVKTVIYILNMLEIRLKSENARHPDVSAITSDLPLSEYNKI